MTVYVVTRRDGRDSEIENIFDSLEKAQQYKSEAKTDDYKYSNYEYQYDIECFDVL